MEKGDAPPAGAPARGFINRAAAGLPAGSQRRVEVGDPVAEVVDAGAVALEIFSDRALRIVRGEQLDHGVAERDGNDPGAIGILERAGRRAEDPAVERQRFLEVGDGDPDVGEPGRREAGHEP